MKKLLLTMTILTGFANMQAYNLSDMWDDFKNTAMALGQATKDSLIDGAQLFKANTWDLKIGPCKNGGKVICCTLAAIIAADQAYCWYVNREIMRKFNERKKLAQNEEFQKSPEKHAKGKPGKNKKSSRGA